MSKYDIESFIDDLSTYLKANLTTQITAINTEKGDSALTVPDSSSYAIQTINDKIINYDPFVLIGVDDISAVSITGATAKEYKVILAIIFEDGQNDDSGFRRVWRYQRALEETINPGFNKVNKHVKIKIDSLTPVDVTLASRSAPSRATGVLLSVTIS